MAKVFFFFNRKGLSKANATLFSYRNRILKWFENVCKQQKNVALGHGWIMYLKISLSCAAVLQASDWNVASCSPPCTVLLSRFAPCQLSEVAADHQCSGGTAHTGHPGPGDIGMSPKRGTRWSHQVCGAAAGTGNARTARGPPLFLFSQVAFITFHCQDPRVWDEKL